MKPSSKWIIAGLLFSHLAMLLFFLWDYLYLLGVLPWRLAHFSDYDWLTMGFLFVLLALISYLLTSHYTYEDGTGIFPDQTRWQRRSFYGGRSGLTVYSLLLILLVLSRTEHFLTAYIELFPLVFSGSFLGSIFRSLLVIHRENRNSTDSLFDR